MGRHPDFPKCQMCYGVPKPSHPKVIHPPEFLGLGQMLGKSNRLGWEGKVNKTSSQLTRKGKTCDLHLLVIADTGSWFMTCRRRTAQGQCFIHP